MSDESVESGASVQNDPSDTSAAASQLARLHATDSLRAIGEVAVVSLTFHGLGVVGSKWAECDAKLVRDVRQRLEKKVKHVLGASYVAEQLVLSQTGLSFHLYASGADSGPTAWALMLGGQQYESQSRPGATWIAKVDRFCEEARRDLRTYLSKRMQSPVDATIEWAIGKDLQFTGRESSDDSDGRLQEQLRELRRRHRIVQSRRRSLFWIVAILIAAVGVAVLFGLDVVMAAFGFLYILPVLLGAFNLSGEAATLWDEARELEANIDLREVLTDDERRAHRLFRVNGLEVKRYYDQARLQRSWVFLMGVGCILLGFSIVALVSYFLLYKMNEAALSEKIVVAGLGAVAGILANFVAIVFLRMFSETVKSTVDFHNRLVVTHHAHFANVLVERISDTALKDQTLARVAMAIGVPMKEKSEQRETPEK